MNVFVLFLLLNLLVLLPILVFGLILHFLNKITKLNIASNKILRSVFIVVNALGVPVHEISHLIASIVFCHKIEKVSLYRPIKSKEDGVLGYVRYRYNFTNLYQQIGVFISGIAPMIGGPLVILLILRLLLPITFSSFNFQISDSSLSSILEIIRFNLEILLMRKDGLLRLIAFLVLSCSISINMDISKTDFANSKKGLVFFEMVLFVVSLIFMIININIVPKIVIAGTYLILILFIGTIFSIISLIFSLISKIF